MAKTETTKKETKTETTKKETKATAAKATSKATSKANVETKVGATMNTETLIKEISEASKNTDRPISQVEASAYLNLFKDVVKKSLGEGQKIQITGFLSFSPAYRGPRKGNNVITGESMDIPGGVVVSIKAGKALKDVMREMDDSLVKAIQKKS